MVIEVPFELGQRVWVVYREAITKKEVERWYDHLGILLSMANVDDIEIKKIGNIIYYRYFSKKEPYKMVQL